MAVDAAGETGVGAALGVVDVGTEVRVVGHWYELE